ncbi:MAG: hypothetical protein ABI664_14430 [bacterium]
MRAFGLSQWKPLQLLAAWSTYWAGLFLVTLGPAMLAILRVTVPAGAKGSVSAGFGDSAFNLIVKSGDATVWSGTAQAVAITLWIAAPPLLLWLGWLAARPARHRLDGIDTRPAPLLRDAPASLYDREKPRREGVDRERTP